MKRRVFQRQLPVATKQASPHQAPFEPDKVCLENGWYKLLAGNTFRAAQSLPHRRIVVNALAKNRLGSVRAPYGREPTAKLTSSQNNLQHQLEHQLRGSLVSLRELVLSAKGRKRLLGRYLKRWYGSIGAIFRGVLRLSGATELPQTPEELVRQMNDSLGLEAGPFLSLLHYRNGERTDPNALATELLIRLESLVAIVDAFEAKDA